MEKEEEEEEEEEEEKEAGRTALGTRMRPRPDGKAAGEKPLARWRLPTMLMARNNNIAVTGAVVLQGFKLFQLVPTPPALARAQDAKRENSKMAEIEVVELPP